MSEIVERLETTGIESEVVDGDLETLGHVLMLDYDDADLETVKDDIETLRGPTALVQSSPGSYHVYGLEIRSWDDVVLALEESNASREYVREMTRRGECTLRVSGKIDAVGEAVVPTPAPLAVKLTQPSTSIPVSRPHTAQLRQMSETVGTHSTARALRTIEAGRVEGLEPVGEKLARSRYETRGGGRNADN